MPRLDVVENGERRTVEFADAIVIGRDRENGVVINDPSLSRRHCQVTREAGRYFLEDLKSSNGTLLNGRRAAKIELTEGDKIEVGQVAMVFSLQSAAPAQAVAPAPAPAAAPAAPAPDNRAGETPYLEYCDGPQAGERVPVTTEAFSIGRKQGNGLALNDKRVSGKHASIIRDGGDWFVVDHDSGNGVIIDGARVKRAPVGNGTVLVLGETQLRCGGFPHDASAPVATAAKPAAAAPVAARPAAASKAVPAQEGVKGDEFSGEEVRRLRVEAAPQGSGALQVVGTLLFLVAFVAILYFGADLISKRLAGTRVEVDPNNLVTSNPSFENVAEAGALVGWRVCPDGDGARLEAATAKKEMSDGMRAARFTATDSAHGFVRLRNESLINVEPGQKFSIFGMVQNSGFELTALEVLWMRRGSDGDEVVAESVTRGVSTGPGYRPLSATVVAPDGLGVEYCCVAVLGWGGNGSLLVDQVSLTPAGESETVAASESFELEDNGRTVRALCGGVTRVCVIEGRSRTLIQGVRLANLQGGFPFGEILGRTVEPRQQGDGGIVREGGEFPVDGYRSRLQYETTVEKREGSLQFGWQVRKAPSAAQQLVLVVELSDFAAQLPMGVFGAGVSRPGADLAALDGVEFTEWQLGTRDQQISLHFSDPVELRVAKAGEARAGVPTVFLVLPRSARDSRFTASLFLGSPREQEQIDAQLAEVDDLVAEARGGEALAKVSALAEQYPWREDLRDIVSERREAIQLSGEQQLAVLREMRSELLEYPGSPIQDLLRERAEWLSESYAGSSVGEKAGELREWIESELGSAATAREENAAKQLIKQADQRFDVGLYYRARFYYQQVVERFPGTDEARHAKSRLQSVKTHTRVRKER